MGQKVSPIGMRVGVIRDWESRWYAEKDYGTLLMEDVKIREFLLKDCLLYTSSEKTRTWPVLRRSGPINPRFS